jgi:hypothetical protein
MEMSLDRLVEKAERLLKSHRVEPLGQGTYNVIGDHGTYTVVQDYSGRVNCNCPGFLKNGKCSHATAVIILATPQGKKRRMQQRKARG